MTGETIVSPVFSASANLKLTAERLFQAVFSIVLALIFRTVYRSFKRETVLTAAYCDLITISLIAGITTITAGRGTWLAARIAAGADLFRADRLVNGKYECYAVCLTAGASYTSGLRSWGSVSVADGSNEVQSVARQSKYRRITACHLSGCYSLSAFVSYQNVKIFFLAGTYCEKLFNSNCKTAFSVGYASQLYSVLSHGRILWLHRTKGGGCLK